MPSASAPGINSESRKSSQLKFLYTIFDLLPEAENGGKSAQNGRTITMITTITMNSVGTSFMIR